MRSKWQAQTLERGIRRATIRQFRRNNPSVSLSNIATAMGTSRAYVLRALAEAPNALDDELAAGWFDTPERLYRALAGDLSYVTSEMMRSKQAGALLMRCR